MSSMWYFSLKKKTENLTNDIMRVAFNLSMPSRDVINSFSLHYFLMFANSPHRIMCSTRPRRTTWNEDANSVRDPADMASPPKPVTFSWLAVGTGWPSTSDMYWERSDSWFWSMFGVTKHWLRFAIRIRMTPDTGAISSLTTSLFDTCGNANRFLYWTEFTWLNSDGYLAIHINQNRNEFRHKNKTRKYIFPIGWYCSRTVPW